MVLPGAITAIKTQINLQHSEKAAVQITITVHGEVDLPTTHPINAEELCHVVKCVFPPLTVRQRTSTVNTIQVTIHVALITGAANQPSTHPGALDLVEVNNLLLRVVEVEQEVLLLQMVAIHRNQ